VPYNKRKNISRLYFNSIQNYYDIVILLLIFTYIMDVYSTTLKFYRKRIKSEKICNIVVLGPLTS
jgi:hypothetical protein